MSYFGSTYFGPTMTGSSGVAASVIDANGSIFAQVGATPTVTIQCNQDVTATALLFRVETQQKTDVASVVDASITREAATARLVLTSAMTTSERTLRWSLTIVSTGEAVAAGLMFVTYDAQGD